MRTKLEKEKEAAKARYEELLAALNVMNATHKNMLFEIMPNQALFDQMYENDSVAPLHIEFKSKNTGATWTLENKFFPHGWWLTIPEDATKEEKNYMRDVMLETIAHPKIAHEDYEPELVNCFPEDTSEDEIFEFIEAAEKKGIKVHLFIGKLSDAEKIHATHLQKTNELTAAGDYEKLPGWNGFVSMIQNSTGGKKGEEMMEKYTSENKNSFRCS